MVIQDVIHKHRYINRDRSDTASQEFQSKRALIASEIKSLESSGSKIRLELAQISESQLLFDLYAKRFTAAFSQNDKKDSSMDSVELTKTFRTFKEAQVRKLKADYEKQNRLKKAIEDIEGDIARLKKEVGEKVSIDESNTKESKEVTIIVSTDVETSFDFDLSYGNLLV